MSDESRQGDEAGVSDLTTTILAVIPDLMFQSRVREQAQALGFEVATADTMDEAIQALERLPGLLVLDLHAMGIDTAALAADAKARAVPVLAFGRHTETGVLRAAREAGCDAVVVRSTFVEELPQLLRELARQ